MVKLIGNTALLDFLPADQIFPLYVENGEVVSCAFLGRNGTCCDADGEALTLEQAARLSDVISSEK
mgnify:CR=1 FL=1